MKKDIELPEVTDVGIAIVRESNNEGELVWNSYVINAKSELIEGVLVSSKGYGTIDGESKKTSTLRHFLDELPPNSSRKIEPIIEEVFGLFNEYWLSFYCEKKMFDKKFIFVPEAISESNFTDLPVLNKRGVLIMSSQ